jgi:hypothetical protein
MCIFIYPSGWQIARLKTRLLCCHNINNPHPISQLTFAGVDDLTIFLKTTLQQSDVLVLN